MRFFLDHDVPADIARVLRQEGHDVLELRNALPVNVSDQEVFRFAWEQNRLILTCNRDDFLALAAVEPFHGIIVLFRRHTRQSECGHLLRLFQLAGESGLAKNINFA